jgi:hypothetical protein
MARPVPSGFAGGELLSAGSSSVLALMLKHGVFRHILWRETLADGAVRVGG